MYKAVQWAVARQKKGVMVNVVPMLLFWEHGIKQHSFGK
jgi:hypothetical protein